MDVLTLPRTAKPVTDKQVRDLNWAFQTRAARPDQCSYCGSKVRTEAHQAWCVHAQTHDLPAFLRPQAE